MIDDKTFVADVWKLAESFVVGRTLSYKFVYIGVELDRSKTVFAILAMPEKCEAGHQCKRKISTLCKGRKGMRHPNSFPPLNE